MSVSQAGNPAKARVRAFWEDEPCGSRHSDSAPGSPGFFAEVDRRRYELEPFIGDFARFDDARGHRLLEVGIGLGSDFVRFVRAGAVATGVDLTQRAVELVRRRLELEGLEASVEAADAEALPFADASFDRVYSWGVLHHTPATERAIAEVRRVLAPGGELCVMLYGRRSWVAYGLWGRYALLRGKPRRSRADVLAHHMESEGTKAFTDGELREMFASFDDVRIEHVATRQDRMVAGPLARLTGRRLGWFVVIRGRKTASAS